MKALVSLGICSDSPELSMLAYTKYIWEECSGSVDRAFDWRSKGC